TGLGLAIVKHVLLNHDGQLEINSAPGKGSEFICHFPAERLVRGALGGESRTADFGSK
ncbi:MAG: PAS domain-containing sensor histidine kinase, partial [Oleiphilaceae bacterium]|nr:PAS domain-containing sensor histidine kinase [Oleiphilaceae bacterium]